LWRVLGREFYERKGYCRGIRGNKRETFGAFMGLKVWEVFGREIEGMIMLRRSGGE